MGNAEVEVGDLQGGASDPSSDSERSVPTSNQRSAADGRVVASVLFAVALLLLSVLLPWASDEDSIEWNFSGQRTGFEAAAKVYLWGINVEVTPVGGSGTAGSTSVSWFNSELNDEDGTGRLSMVRTGVVLFGLGAIFAMATLAGALQSVRLRPALPIAAASLLGLGTFLFVGAIIEDGGSKLWGTWLAAFLAIISLGGTAFLVSNGGRHSDRQTPPRDGGPEG